MARHCDAVLPSSSCQGWGIWYRFIMVRVAILCHKASLNDGLWQGGDDEGVWMVRSWFGGVSQTHC